MILISCGKQVIQKRSFYLISLGLNSGVNSEKLDKWTLLYNMQKITFTFGTISHIRHTKYFFIHLTRENEA